MVGRSRSQSRQGDHRGRGEDQRGSKPAPNPWWQCADCGWKNAGSNRFCGSCSVIKTKRSIDLPPRSGGSKGGGGKGSAGGKGGGKGGGGAGQPPCPTHRVPARGASPNRGPVGARDKPTGTTSLPQAGAVIITIEKVGTENFISASGGTARQRKREVAKRLQEHPEWKRQQRDPLPATPQATATEGGQPAGGQAGLSAGQPATDAALDAAMEEQPPGDIDKQIQVLELRVKYMVGDEEIQQNIWGRDAYLTKLEEARKELDDARERRRQSKPLPKRVKIAEHKLNDCAQRHQKQAALLDQLAKDRFRLVEEHRLALLAMDAKMEVQTKVIAKTFSDHSKAQEDCARLVAEQAQVVGAAAAPESAPQHADAPPGRVVAGQWHPDTCREISEDIRGSGRDPEFQKQFIQWLDERANARSAAAAAATAVDRDASNPEASAKPVEETDAEKRSQADAVTEEAARKLLRNENGEAVPVSGNKQSA